MTKGITRDAEAEYWDTHEVVGRGKGFRKVPAASVENLEYRLNLRLTRSDLHRLAAEAGRRGVRFTELARQFILEGLGRAEHEPLEVRLEALAREVEALKARRD